MPRATCRCGQELPIPTDGSDRVVCPKCQARVKLRRAPAPARPPVEMSDGFIRFFCPCGRRLKVNAVKRPPTGKCPDCGRVVPVPDPAQPAAQDLPPGHPEAPTRDMNAVDMAAIEQWARGHVAGPAAAQAAPSDPSASSTTIQPPPAANRVEAGLRVCPRCGKPLHLSATTCRACGASVPKR